MSELPEGWIEAQLGDLGSWTSGGTPSRKNPSYYDGDIPWVKTGDLRDGPIRGPLETISEAGLANSSAKMLPRGAVLMAMYGATIGRLGVLTHEATCNQACAALLPQPENEASLPLVFHYLKSSREALKREGKGGAQPNISQGLIKEFGIPLPPINEQKRIVAKIDALTEKSREAREALDEVPDLLDKLRQSILAAAFRGDLTKKWREQNPDTEPASVLLDRIRQERRKKWEEAELAKFKAKGKVPKDDKWKAKYKEPEPVDAEGLPELPKGWCWASVETIALLESGQTPKAIEGSSLPESTIPFVRVGDMNRVGNEQVIRTAEVMLSPVETSKLGLHVRPAGTIIFPKRGGAIGTNKKRRLGIASAYDLNTMGLVPADSISSWLWLWFQTVHLLDLHNGGVIPQINNGDVAPLLLPLAPENEQRELVRLLPSLLEIIAAGSLELAQKNLQLNQLDSSILAKAFRGELVPQDPDDEPASVLLERIRAEREKAGGGKKKRSKGA